MSDDHFFANVVVAVWVPGYERDKVGEGVSSIGPRRCKRQVLAYTHLLHRALLQLWVLVSNCLCGRLCIVL